MPRISGVSTAVPPYRIDQSDAKRFAERIFGSHISDIARLLPLFDHTGIKTRYFSEQVEWFETEHSLDEKNHSYIRSATDLGAQCARSLLKKTGAQTEQIDYIMYVNTTGLATPSIDARLINVLNLRHNIRRTPIWGLGCAGGAAGLSHAYHYLLGHPDHRVLLVAVELCGLTFLRNDFSKSNLTACALFGDGAAAVLICGDEVEASGPEIVATQSTFYPDSLKVMGWNIISSGMQVVFDKRIPDIVAANAADELSTFLAQNHLRQDRIKKFLYHPGGMKVVEAYEAAYHSNGKGFELSREILRDFGNMSSVTVLFVLSRYMDLLSQEEQGYSVVSALGPGFCSESLLLKS